MTGRDRMLRPEPIRRLLLLITGLMGIPITDMAGVTAILTTRDSHYSWAADTMGVDFTAAAVTTVDADSTAVDADFMVAAADFTVAAAVT